MRRSERENTTYEPLSAISGPKAFGGADAKSKGPEVEGETNGERKERFRRYTKNSREKCEGEATVSGSRQGVSYMCPLRYSVMLASIIAIYFY